MNPDTHPSGIIAIRDSLPAHEYGKLAILYGQHITAMVGIFECIEESEVEPQKPAMSMVTARDPKTIQNALQKKGYKAQMDTDSRGDPRIKSRVSGLNYSIYFYGCEERKNCNSIQFSLGIGLADGMSFERANQWNWKKRLSIELDDENDPFLRWNLMMGPDGIPSSTFDEVFALWEVAVDQFKDFVDP
ncbi:MAG: YbjN domain-containing protein, partial [Alphaproteobacteria bacterium]|nr:YbjN domain-containing protein [Alphaproteobacteria bacterium]